MNSDRKAKKDKGLVATLYDLMYLASGEEYDKVRAMIQTAFPQVKIEDASDDIHGHRFSVNMSISKYDWYKWLLSQGLQKRSLWFQMDALQGRDQAIAR